MGNLISPHVNLKYQAPLYHGIISVGQGDIADQRVLAAIVTMIVALAAIVREIGVLAAIVKAVVAVPVPTAREVGVLAATVKVTVAPAAIVREIGVPVPIAKAVAVLVATVWEAEAASQAHLVRVHGNQQKAVLVVGHKRGDHVQVDLDGQGGQRVRAEHPGQPHHLSPKKRKLHHHSPLRQLQSR